MKNRKPLIITLLIVSFVLFSGLALLIGYGLHQFKWYTDFTIMWAILATLVVVPLVGIVGFFIFLTNQKHRLFHSTLLTFLFVATLALPLVGLVTYRVMDNIEYRQYYRFTPEKWAEMDANDRGRMIASFRHQYDIIGYDYTEVIALLGNPDTTSESEIFYNIDDYGALIAIDPYYYAIEFNTINVVVKEYILST